MNRERLEEIRKLLVNLYNAVDVDEEMKHYIFNDLKIEWLIEQSERVYELEQQNKRYREALEFYADRENYNPNPNYCDPDIDEYISTIDYDNGATARKALEG